MSDARQYGRMQRFQDAVDAFRNRPAPQPQPTIVPQRLYDAIAASDDPGLRRLIRDKLVEPVNPYAGMALSLHNHTAEEAGRDDCTYYPAP